MVLCALHLVSLRPGVSLAGFLAALRRAGVDRPVVQARVARWMVLPARLSAGDLLARNVRWDALVLLRQRDHHDGNGDNKTADIPAAVADACVAALWSATVGTSARALDGYADANAALLNPPPGAVPALDDDEIPPAAASTSDVGGSGNNNLEMTPELGRWIDALPAALAAHPVSMLNLLAFAPGRHDQYVRYGQEFSRRVGSRHGGRVKVVGRVVHAPNKDDGSGGSGNASDDDAAGWDEVAFVHYPSVRHFAAMAASADYQEVNRTSRLGALRDTFIICVVEVDDDGEVVNAGGRARAQQGKL
ncbi:hypothetical protein GGR56DRAFT_629302 [Xylariaceae sp. FL0804]|nr:hypothetical protein GGR56DRAFT_629302 [Xylariaceae sp. FL0804]